MSQSKETAADMTTQYPPKTRPITGAVSAATSGAGLAVATAGATANVGVLL